MIWVLLCLLLISLCMKLNDILIMHQFICLSRFGVQIRQYLDLLTKNLILRRKFIKSFLQGFLPGLALKIFLYILPTVLMVMSKVEGYIAHSALERRAAAKYYYFMLVNVFLGSIIAGTAFEQLDAFLHQSPTQ